MLAHMICEGLGAEAWKPRMEMAEDTREGSSTEDSRLGRARRAVFAAARGSALRRRRREPEALRMAGDCLTVRRGGRQKAAECGMDPWQKGGSLRHQPRYREQETRNNEAGSEQGMGAALEERNQ